MDGEAILFTGLGGEGLGPKSMGRAGPVLKVDAHGAHVRRTKESWEDQKAG